MKISVNSQKSFSVRHYTKFKFIALLERWHPTDAGGYGLPHQPAGWFALTSIADA